jgi:hypothetical protein
MKTIKINIRVCILGEAEIIQEKLTRAIHRFEIFKPHKLSCEITEHKQSLKQVDYNDWSYDLTINTNDDRENIFSLGWTICNAGFHSFEIKEIEE